jgi:hypothetical protein
VALILVANYGLHRLRPRWQALQTWEAEEAELNDRLSGLKASESPSRAAALERRAQRSRQALDRSRDHVARLDERLARDDQAGELAWQLAALAQESHLRIESEEEAPALPQRGGAVIGDLGSALQRPPFGRPLHAWTVRGGFRDLWSFLTRLEQLPWQAVVVDLQVERPSHLESHDPPLLIKLVVAL